MNKRVNGLVVLSMGLALLAGCRDRDRGGQEKIALPAPAGTPKRPQGMHALNGNPNNPQPFKQLDVATYFQTHNLPMNSTTVGQFQVASLEFMTSKEASDRLQGVATGLADSERVGFVTLTGTFIFTGPPKSKPVTFSRAYALFAASGDLLMVGGLDQGSSTQPKR